MALIHNNRPFDPDAIPSPVVGIALDAHQHDSGMHQHRKGQLLYAPSGCINFAFEQSISILPPTRAVWIPANTPHQAVMTKVVAYRSLYFDATEFQCPQQVRTIKVNALLKALINKMALWEWDTEPQQMRNTNALFWEEFNQLRHTICSLPCPRIVAFVI
ncbi:AraC family ligand binding domain-containing protein [Ferrimonas aestuarii]|uniref:AraC family ligand binding domain-containing protein n=1 Tax=Ferrimonas aestuarii TaxID=2569539 RepID=UPI001E653254|nr:AraC family ligand binding domain-containing protein [Ferrimonas aestuarii]